MGAQDLDSSIPDHGEPPVKPARPMLRVRRLSGDMLSTPSTGNAESSLNVKEDALTSNTLCPVNPPDSVIGKEGPEGLSSRLGFPIRMLNILKERSLPDYNPLMSAITYKSEDSYKAMCTPSKLRDLYKCMGSNCSFTTNCSKVFASHFNQHSKMSLSAAANNEIVWHWDICCYCFTTHKTSRDLCIHLKKEHSNCVLQCGNCFYRSHSIDNVHFHHTVEHPLANFVVLQCKQKETDQPPIADKPFTECVIPLSCSEASCMMSTYMLQNFCYHLYNVHKHLQCNQCREWSVSPEMLIKHYKDAHGICVYQCVYCIYGAFTEHQIRTHLCYKHPGSVPKSIHRIDTGGNKKGVQDNQESLRRIVFNKDHDKLLRYLVPYPETDDISSEGISSPSLETKTKPPMISPSRPVMFRGISSPGILKKQLENSDITSQGSLELPTNKESNVTFPKIVPVIRPVIRPCNSKGAPKFYKIIPKPIFHLVSANNNPHSLSVSRIAQPKESYNLVVTSSASPTITTCASIVVTIPSAPTVTTSVLSGPSAVSKTTASCTSPSLSSSETKASTVNSDTSKKEFENEPLVEENYFRCGNTGCEFAGSTSAQLRSHLVICDYARQTERLKCVFCNRHFKHVASLIAHLPSHGPARFSCSVCDFKATLQAQVTVHMKFTHGIYNTILIPVNTLKQDMEKDYFIVSSKAQEKRTRGYERTVIKGSRGGFVVPKMKFSPQELEEIPKTAIFNYQLGCSLCTYETKVRSNLLRHMTQHAQGDSVSQEEVVNPVPNKKEKMFDKMMNLAGSSQKKKNKEIGTEAEMPCPFKYVPDQLRYMCHVEECGYRSLSETMLRDHVSVIHTEEISYKCPHCPKIDSLIPIDQLGLHLKLHDSPLFKCDYCDFYSHIRRSIEKHQLQYHTGVDGMVQIVRMGKPDIPLPEKILVRPLQFGQAEEQGEEWYICNLCKFQTKKKKFMLAHGISEHEMTKPFSCSICSYETVNDTLLKTHFKTTHNEESDSSHIVTFFKKVTQVKVNSPAPILPLWKRDPKKIKLIRGISIDEKGDAPPPVATCVNLDLSTVDRSQLKYGPYGSPIDGLYLCPRCSIFQTKNRGDFKEHLYKHFDYKPLACALCALSTTQRSKITKHICKVHNVDMHQTDLHINLNINEDFENWVEKAINTQFNILKEAVQKTVINPTTDIPQINIKNLRKSLDESIHQPTPPLPLEIIDAHVASSLPSPAVSPFQSSTLPQNETKEDNELSCGKTSPSSGVGFGGVVPEKKKKRDTSPSKHRFRCRHCSKTAKFKNSLRAHSKKMHQNLPVDIISLTKSTISETRTAFNCAYCDCVALNERNLKTHWVLKHRTNNPNFMFTKVNVHSDLEYRCHWCFELNSINSLQEHCKKSHPEQCCLVVPVQVTQYKCSSCSLVFKSVDILKRHFSMNHTTQQFSFIYMTAQKRLTSPNKTSSSVKQSPDMFWPKKIYKCPNCQYTTPIYEAVVKHIEKHFLTYICSKCEAYFSSLYNIRIHVRIKHAGSPPKINTLEGSQADIENSIKKIIIILPSGKRRKITQEELANAEKESISVQNTDLEYMYEEPLEDGSITAPKLMETARKSTAPPRISRVKFCTQTSKESPNRDDFFINCTSPDKPLKVPLTSFRTLWPKVKIPFILNQNRPEKT